MPEPLHRLVYDATIDDAVDVSLRMAGRTKAFQSQVRWNVVIVGILSGLAFAVAWLYISPEGTAPALPLVLAAGAAFGAGFAYIFKRFLMTEIRKQHRKIIAEQFGNRPAIPSELELRPDAVWVRQAGMEMTFPWTLCTGIQDNPDDIQMDFSPGMCVLRSRHFASPAERQAFLATARKLAGTSTVGR